MDLAGKLELNFINNFQPAISDTYTILSYKGRTSEFDKLKVSGLFPNRKAKLDYLPNVLNVIIEEQVNQPPSITLLAPSQNDEISTTTYAIRWMDEDPDDDAIIVLYYSSYITATLGTIIVDDLSEDDESDFYLWDASVIPEGIYWIKAVILDGVNYPWLSAAPGSVKVTHVTKQELNDHLLAESSLPIERLSFADFNNDGIIDVADLVALCGIWGTSP